MLSEVTLIFLHHLPYFAKKWIFCYDWRNQFWHLKFAYFVNFKARDSPPCFFFPSKKKLALHSNPCKQLTCNLCPSLSLSLSALKNGNWKSSLIRYIKKSFYFIPPHLIIPPVSFNYSRELKFRVKKLKFFFNFG